MKHRCSIFATMPLLLGIVTVIAAQPAALSPAQQENADSATLVRLERADSQFTVRIDTLQEQLEKHRFAENFLDSALEEQANRFSLIIGALLTAVGFFTYQGFRHEIHRLHTEISSQILEQKSAIEAAVTRVEKAELRLMGTSGNVHRTIAELHANRKGYVLAFQHSFTAAGFFYNRYKLAPDKTEADTLSARRTAIANLKLSLGHLKQLNAQDPARVGAALQKREDVIRRAFDRLNSPDDPEVQDLSAEIRLMLRGFGEASRTAEAQVE